MATSGSIPIICHCLSVHRLKRMKNKISEYGLYITKTVDYEVSCGVLVGSVLKATWTGVGSSVIFVSAAATTIHRHHLSSGIRA